MAAPRVDRDHARGQRAAASARARGDGALAAALAAIEATFSPAIRHSTFKRRVAALMMLGADHHEVRFRYQNLAERYAGANLDTAVAMVERLYRCEIDARENAARLWGRCSRPRIALMRLEELRLLLRMLRRHAPARYPGLVGTVIADDGGEYFAAAAAEAAE
jgi:hypothetical protein